MNLLVAGTSFKGDNEMKNVTAREILADMKALDHGMSEANEELSDFDKQMQQSLGQYMPKTR